MILNPTIGMSYPTGDKSFYESYTRQQHCKERIQGYETQRQMLRNHLDKSILSKEWLLYLYPEEFS